MRKYLAIGFSAVLGCASVIIVLLRIGFPHHRSLALTVYLAGWAALFYGIWQYRATRTVTVSLAGKLRHIAAGLILGATGYCLLVIVPVKETVFLSIDPVTLQQNLDHDLAQVQVPLRNLEILYEPGGDAELVLRQNYTSPRPEQKEVLLQFWSYYLDNVLTLEQLKNRHRHFYQINYLSYPKLNLRSFLIAYSSFIANYASVLRLHDLVEDNHALITLLDEQRNDLGIPAKGYYSLMQGITSPDSLIMLNAGYGHLQIVQKLSAFDNKTDRMLVDYCEAGFDEIYRLLGRQPGVIKNIPLDFYEQTTFRLWFPLQKQVSEAMGDIRTTDRPNLITETAAHDARTLCEPGDIIIERRNWYLSNVGLPGFWPHAALYTGSLDELDTYFNGCVQLNSRSFSDYLKTEYPAIYAAYQETAPYPPSVLEAVSEGVILHPFELSAAADYVAVLRPRFPKPDKLEAILTAYGFYQRPYDFNFDFVTDNELVCSEVVYKAYLPGTKRNGLHFEIGLTAGRRVPTPNNIARKFDQEYDADTRELDFVLFLDGSEQAGTATRRAAADLRASWQRPKWDIAQE